MGVRRGSGLLCSSTNAFPVGQRHCGHQLTSCDCLRHKSRNRMCKALTIAIRSPCTAPIHGTAAPPVPLAQESLSVRRRSSLLPSGACAPCMLCPTARTRGSPGPSISPLTYFAKTQRHCGATSARDVDLMCSADGTRDFEESPAAPPARPPPHAAPNRELIAARRPRRGWSSRATYGPRPPRRRRPAREELGLVRRAAWTATVLLDAAMHERPDRDRAREPRRAAAARAACCPSPAVALVVTPRAAARASSSAARSARGIPLR